MARTIADTNLVVSAESKIGNVLTGADHVLIINGLEDLFFEIQEFGKMGLKTGKIDYVGVRGVSFSRSSVVQTLNDIPITLLHREGLLTKQKIEKIIASKNYDISGTIISGINLSEGIVYAKFKLGHISSDDSGTASVESRSSADTITYNLSCHYEYVEKSEAQNIINRLRTFV